MRIPLHRVNTGSSVHKSAQQELDNGFHDLFRQASADEVAARDRFGKLKQHMLITGSIMYHWCSAEWS